MSSLLSENEMTLSKNSRDKPPKRFYYSEVRKVWESAMWVLYSIGSFLETTLKTR